MNEDPRAGLHAGDQAVALKGVRSDATLRGPTAEVTVTQRYRNDEATPVEAVYLFPLDEGAAVCGFEARIDGTLVIGRVMEREAAFEAYGDAMVEGHGAYLLDQERPDVFTASVGNLPPGAEMELTLRYVALVEREDDALRFTLPTTVAPRYVPVRGPEIGQPDEEKLNPPHWARVPYGLALSVAVDAGGLRRVASPTHPIETSLREGGADVRLGQDETALDRDFVLLVAADTSPQALVAREDDGTRVALVTFAPTAPPPEAMDVVFVRRSSPGPRLAAASRAEPRSPRGRDARGPRRALRPGEPSHELRRHRRARCWGTGHRAGDAPAHSDLALGGLGRRAGPREGRQDAGGEAAPPVGAMQALALTEPAMPRSAPRGRRKGGVLRALATNLRGGADVAGSARPPAPPPARRRARGSGRVAAGAPDTLFDLLMTQRADGHSSGATRCASSSGSGVHESSTKRSRGRRPTPRSS